jgi:O-antigen ligase
VIILKLLLATALIVLLGVIWIARRSRGTPILLFPLLAAGLSVALSTLTSIDPLRSIFGLTVTIIVIVVYMVLVDLDGEILGRGLAVLMYLLALVGVLDAGRKAIPLLFTTERFSFYALAASPLGMNSNIYAIIIVVGSALAVKRLQTASPKWRFRVVLWLITSYVAIALSMSRGAWIGWLAGAIALVALSPGVRAALARPWRAAAALITVGLLNPVVLRALHKLAQPSYESIALSTTGRRLIWQGAVEQFLERPIVGVGPWNFGPLFDARYHPSIYKPHAHNLLLQTAAETGIVGVLALLAVLITALVLIVRAYRDPERRESAALAIALAAALMAEGLVDYPYAGPTVDILILAVWNRVFPANVPTARWHLVVISAALGLMFAAQAGAALLLRAP